MVCRLCLSECDSNVIIFCDEKIPEYIARFLQLKLTPDDPISKVICDQCWTELKNFGSFYLLVDEAQRNISAIHDKSTNEFNQNGGSEALNVVRAKSELISLKREASEVDDATVATADMFDFFDIVELQKEEIIEPATITPLQTNELVSVENITCPSGIKRVLSDENISKGIERICLRPRPKPLGNVNAKRGLQSVEGRALKKVITERSAKLWEKSKEFDEIINKSMQLVCNICATNLLDFRDLQRHFRRTHKTKGYAVCCNKRLYKRGLLVDHIKAYHQKLYTCQTCGKGSSSLARLQKHTPMCARQMTCLREGPRVKKVMTERSKKIWAKSKEFDKIIQNTIELYCYICAIKIVNFRELQLHFRRAHRIKGYVMCCSKRFYKRGVLINHINRHSRKHSSSLARQRHKDMSTKRMAIVEDKSTELQPNEKTEMTFISQPAESLDTNEQFPKLKSTTAVSKQQKAQKGVGNVVKIKRGRPRKEVNKSKKVKLERNARLWTKYI